MKEKTKEILHVILGGVAIAVAAVVIIGLIMFATRWFSQEMTPINTVKMEGNVTCYQIITGDGAAISCVQLNLRKLPK